MTSSVTNMRIAALDIGSNSIHLAVVDMEDSGRQQILIREKTSVKLAKGLARSGVIAPENFQAGLQALKRMASLINHQQCDTFIACASEVLREAANGQEFVEEAAKLGVPIRIISGEEKARLIYEAVQRELPFPSEPSALMDLGASATLVTWVANNRVLASIPIPWGVQRVADALAASDPPLPQDLMRMRKLLRKIVKKARKQLPSDQPSARMVMGTSGALMALALGASGSHECTREQLQRFERKLWRASAKARAEQLGVDPKRADTLHIAASWTLGLLRWLGAERIQCLPVGLREGLVWEAMRNGGAALPGLLERRRAAVETLADRLDPAPAHSTQVARLADQLYLDLGSQFELGDPERELLAWAARLHDIGLSISEKGHHKHSAYLVRNANLPGFSPTEKELLAQVVRFHRGKSPRKSGDAAFDVLPPWHQQVVEKLAAILRVANALDRSRRQAVREARFYCEGDEAHLLIHTESDFAIELEALQDQGRMLFKLLDRAMKVVVA